MTGYNFSGSSLQAIFDYLLAQATYNRLLLGILVSVQRTTVVALKAVLLQSLIQEK